MIHDATLRRKSSAGEIPSGAASESQSAQARLSLSKKIEAVIASERASFHTPGHKGRPHSFGADKNFSFALAGDVTELPGLDDLSRPDGVLLSLETRLSNLFNARRSFLSVNGASACLLAALMTAATVGRRILVPTNLHRAAVNGLALANLEPVWYKPEWNSTYGIYQEVTEAVVEEQLSATNANSLLVVSPTYGGAVSDIGAIASVCKKRGVLLIVDEAHGAHLLSPDLLPISALSCGADIVVHSLHKTLPALTQTGALHIAHDSLFSLDGARLFLTALQSSSPSYQLMASVDKLVDFVSSSSGIKRLQQIVGLAEDLRSRVAGSSLYEVYAGAAFHEPLHVLLRPLFSVDLALELQKRGIGIEAVFNKSLLCLLGMGSEQCDVDLLVESLLDIAEQAGGQPHAEDDIQAPPLFVQSIEPGEAFKLPSNVVPIEAAAGLISAECIAPCPPGTPVVVPGQLLEKESLAYLLQFTGIRSLRVVEKI